MEQDGVASVWFGVAESLEDLERYIEIGYTADGDSIDSRFGTNFEFGYYDEDTIEIYFDENGEYKIEDRLHDFSYSEQMIRKIKDLLDGEAFEYSFNSVIVLYDFQYNAAKIQDDSEKIKMNFIGTVPYK